MVRQKQGYISYYYVKSVKPWEMNSFRRNIIGNHPVEVFLLLACTNESYIQKLSIFVFKALTIRKQSLSVSMTL